MQNLNLDYILFDLIGTTIKESQNGKSLILESFQNAFLNNGIELSIANIKKERGKIKREAILNLLANTNADPKLVDKVYEDFISLLNDQVSAFDEIKGAGDLFEIISSKGIKIGIGSGLPLDFIQTVVKKVGWDKRYFNYLVSSEDLGMGRPNPIMILDSMQQLGISNKKRVLKIGDTAVDILEGKNAGVLTAGVLSGASQKEDLEELNPNFIFNDINDLLDLNI